MKIITPIIQFYEDLFISDESELIVSQFNEKEKLLFKKIQEGKIESDKQAATLLYDGNPSSQAYSKMKQKLLEKLYKIVINAEYKGTDKGTQKLKQLARSMHAFDALHKTTTNTAAIQLAKKTVIQAERVQRYHEAMGLAAFLSNHYYTFVKNESQGDKYWNQYLKYSEFHRNNSLITYEYGKLMVKTKKSSYNQEVADKAHIVFDKIKPLTNKENYVSINFYYQIGYLRYAAISDYNGIIENNKKALLFFNESKDIYESPRKLLKLQLVLAYLGKGDYINASKHLNSLESNATDRRYLLLLSLHVKIAFHVQEYNKAVDLIDSTVNSKQVKQARPTDQVRFWLYKYYADIMNALIYGVPINTRKIRNNLTRLSSDKKGLNVPFIIAETIVEIYKNGVNTVYDKIDSLKLYVRKHLKKGENDRSARFIQFLLSLPESNYNSEKFQLDLQETFDFFEENPSIITTKPDNEIIPYENLMHELLKYLKISVKTTNTETVSQEQGSSASDY